MRFEIDRCPRAVPLGRHRHRDAARPSSARCIQAARTLYAAILDRSRPADYDVFTHRATRADLAEGHPRRPDDAAAPRVTTSRPTCWWRPAGSPARCSLWRRAHAAGHDRRRRSAASVSVVDPGAQRGAQPAPAARVARRADRAAARGARGRRRLRRRTAAVARAAGVGVVEAGRRPRAGWASRGRATRASAPRAASTLLFLDADTWLAPDGIARLVAAHDGLAPTGSCPCSRSTAPSGPTSSSRRSATWCRCGQRHGGPGPARARPWPSGPACSRPPTRWPRPAASRPCAARSWRTPPSPAPSAAPAGRCVPRRRRRRCRFRMYPDGLGSLVEGWTQEPRGRAPCGSRRWPLLGAVLWVTRRACPSPSMPSRSRPRRGARSAGRPSPRSCGGCCAGSGSFRWSTAVLFPSRCWPSWPVPRGRCVLRLARRPGDVAGAAHRPTAP